MMQTIPSMLIKAMVRAIGLLLALTAVAAAQDYPTKPVRLIIPFPPGGSNDVVGRVVATQLSERLGHSVVIDNRGGGGGLTATNAPAKSPADGSTLSLPSVAYPVSTPPKASRLAPTH